MQDQRCNNGCKNKQSIPQIKLPILGKSPIVVRCGLQDFQTDPIGATGTVSMWWKNKNDSRGSVGPKRKKQTDKKDNGKEENSSASLGKTRISRDFLFVADPAGPQPACDVGIKETITFFPSLVLFFGCGTLNRLATEGMFFFP